MRGAHYSDASLGKFSWDLSVYRTNSENDIYGISTTIASGFFQNVGSTRREGVDLDLTYRIGERFRLSGI